MVGKTRDVNGVRNVGTGLLAAVLMLAGIAGSAGAYSQTHTNLLQDFSEYAHAAYHENRNEANQDRWGRGIQSTITVYNTCNRGDKHALASWVSVDIFGGATFSGFGQAGFAQLRGDCTQALPFAQFCRAPCDKAALYEPAHFEDPTPVPDEGLAGNFRLVLVNPAGPNPAAPCIVRIGLGLPCPIMMTLAEYQEGMCAAANTQNLDCTVEASVIDLAETGGVFCDGLTGQLARTLSTDCQAVEAARLAVAGGVRECQQGSSPLDPVYDVPLCIMPDPSLSPSPKVAGPTCTLEVYYDGVIIASYAGLDCDKAADARIEYEAAAVDTLDTHVGPGNTDKASLYTSWASIGNLGTSAIPKANRQWVLTDKAICPPYESKFRSSNNLITWANIGPNIDGTNNRCDFEVTSTPGFGWLGVLAAPVALAAMLRRRGRRSPP